MYIGMWVSSTKSFTTHVSYAPATRPWRGIPSSCTLACSLQNDTVLHDCRQKKKIQNPRPPSIPSGRPAVGQNDIVLADSRRSGPAVKHVRNTVTVIVSERKKSLANQKQATARERQRKTLTASSSNPHCLPANQRSPLRSPETWDKRVVVSSMAVNFEPFWASLRFFKYEWNILKNLKILY